MKRSQLNTEFLGDLSRDIRILEVGSNVGTQLQMLQDMGFKNLYGVELQSYAVELSKKLTKDIQIIQGSAQDLPFKDGFFDLVFTSGVLIHINPTDLPAVLAEMLRVTRRWVWGFEYFAEKHEEIPYRNHSNLMWKGDFCQLFLDRDRNLKTLKRKKVPYLNSTNQDEMYLLARA